MAMNQNDEIFIGIDLGTTQSTACYIDPQTGETILITDASGLEQYASVLLFQNDPRKPNEKVVFGNYAKNVPPSEYHVTEVKRFVGIDLEKMDEQLLEKLLNEFPVEENGTGVVFTIPDPKTGEEMRFAPEELLAIEISHIKEIILKRCADAKFNKVVMTLPSSFSDAQIEALKLAYKYAGIEIITTMKEPSAAVYEYRKLTGKNFNRCIVIDIGGGTTDVCVCQQQKERTIVKGNGGNSLLGGSDFDKIMMDLILERLEEDGYDRINDFKIMKKDVKAKKLEKKRNINKLRKGAEKVKIELSKNQAANVQLDEILPKGYDENMALHIGRDEYEAKIREAGLIEEIRNCIDESLRKAKIKANAIDAVILVGGVTFMPIVRQLISDIFGEEKIVKEERYDALTAVAKGAARYAREYHGVIATGEEAKQLETASDGIGVEGAQGMMEFIANEGDELPKKMVKIFTTFADYQDKMDFDLFKGNSRYVENCEYLTTYSVENIEKKPRGQIKVTFTVDIEASGNMKITAKQEGQNVPMQSMNVNCGFTKTDKEQREVIEYLKTYMPK